MTTKYNLALAFATATLLFLGSCKKDDPVIPNEEEIITSLTYTLSPEGGGDEIELIFRDLDGDGGDSPSIIGGTLESNTTYNASLELLNETTSPAGDISAEIIAEAEEHQFFFQITGTLESSVEYNDQDANGNPIGLSTKVSTAGNSSGSLKITLRHEPNKSGAGVSDGDITNAGGETDIEVSFDITIQ